MSKILLQFLARVSVETLKFVVLALLGLALLAVIYVVITYGLADHGCLRWQKSVCRTHW
jgi:hypothetical protein